MVVNATFDSLNLLFYLKTSIKKLIIFQIYEISPGSINPMYISNDGVF